MTINNDLKYWSDDLESGNQLIDYQHRELIRRFETLETAIIQGQGFQEVKSVAAFLQRYVLTHFNTEEQDMLSFNYPRLGEHVAQHDLCKKRIFQFKKYIETEKDKNKVQNLALSMIGLWVRDHILNHDIQYIQYSKEQNKTKKIVNIDYQWSPSKSKIWTPEMEIGVENLDIQHQKLIKWTEYTLNAKSITPREFHRLFDFMQGFTYAHFTDEELFMIDIEFPELEQHTQIHAQIRTQFIDLKKQLEETTDEESFQPLIYDLFKSYTHHIKEIDMQFNNYYKNKFPS
jgi:hemerythrin